MSYFRTIISENLLLTAVTVFILLLNLPFGYWRSGVKKFSLQWFLAVHCPVPIIYTARIFAGLSWTLITFPLFIGAFFLGQYLGSIIRLNQG